MAYRVLVVGGGIAGLTVATALARDGHAVELLERNAELGDQGGVGLSLIGNAMRALDQIGVADGCVASGMPADSLAMCGPDGKVVAELPAPRIGGPQWPGATGIRRAVLHEILAQAARAANVMVHCETTAVDWNEVQGGLDVVLSDGSTRTVDLMIGADGINSRVRQKVLPDAVPEFTGQSVWRAEAPRPASIDRTHLYLGGRHGVVGICPVSDALCYVYIVQTSDGSFRDAATLDEQMRHELEGYLGPVADLAPLIDDPAKVNYRPLEWILAPRPWGRGRVVLIGDAIHANPPVLAQGAAMAIEDAVVLAEELANPAASIDQALASFVERRFDRAARVVTASCELARAEVEKREDVDIPTLMRATTAMLAQPF